MKTKLILLSLSCFLGFGFFFASPVLALDCESPGLTSVENLKCGVKATNPNVNDEESGQNINKIIATVIDILSLIVGVVSVIVIIVQGLRLVVSGSSKDTVKEVRNGIIYALVGLLIVGLAQTIVFFVVDKL